MQKRENLDYRITKKYGILTLGILSALVIVFGIPIIIYLLDPTNDSTSPFCTGGDIPTVPIEVQVNDTILFIGVDDLQVETPLLGAAWLASLCNKPDHPKGGIHINLTTLYPIIPKHVPSPDQIYLTKPHAAIEIDPNNLYGFVEIKPIYNTDIRWSHVIILDQYAMSLIISLYNSNLTLPPPPPPPSLVKPWENPTGAYEQQSAILRTLCEEPESFALFNNVHEIVNLNNTHLKTNLTNDGLILLWQLANYSSGKTVSCNFYP